MVLLPAESIRFFGILLLAGVYGPGDAMARDWPAAASFFFITRPMQRKSEGNHLCQSPAASTR